MKNFTRACCIVPAFLMLSFQAAPAQETGVAPKAPFLATVPENMEWTVTLAYPSPGAPDGYPVQIKTVKTGTSFQFTVSYANGTSQRYDQLGSNIVTPAATGFNLSVFDPDEPPFPHYSTDFLFAGWVRGLGKAAWKGIAVRNGVKCFYYQDVRLEVWIDMKTMLPVAAKDAIFGEATFQFHPAPSSPLVFPPDELAAIQQHDKMVKAFNSIR